MDVTQPLALLGGLSAEQFMRRHWQKKPLLVRQAIAGVRPPLARSALFALAQQDDVESRLIVQEKPAAGAKGGGWTLRHGPIARRTLPPTTQPRWTLLVQGLDLHVATAHELLNRFRFIPDARLDDLMISYATDGGGVGPHIDSYDVFLIQVHGRRRWRIGMADDETLVEGVPLKLLARFKPDEEWVLEPGDMLYLPPQWAHDGIAEGECMTCSVGFRTPTESDLAADVLTRMADAIDRDAGHLYRDPRQGATTAPGLIPPALQAFARRALARAAQGDAMDVALGECLSEPKANVWFAAGGVCREGQALVLDARTRMLYDERYVYINGESFRAVGRDATLMHELADARTLPAARARLLSVSARALVSEWAADGWLHGQ